MRIHIAIPNQGWIHKNVFRACLAMINEPHGHTVSMSFQSDKPIDSNRNKIIKEFLADKDNEVLLFIDSDNPPSANVMHLADLDLDILSFPTPIWYSELSSAGLGHQPNIWNSFKQVGDVEWREWPPQKGLIEIDACGSGCVMIQRRVLEHPDMKPAFKRIWDDDGAAVVGSDLLFCKRAKEAGFKV